jgi:hypothetical protein
MRILLLSITLMGLATPTFAQQRSVRCTGTPLDPLVVAGPVYRDCDVDRPANLRGTAPQPAWTPGTAEAREGRCFRAEFQFVVDTLGVPDLATLQAVAANHTGYAEAVRSTLARLRYEPARLAGRPVRQIVVYRQTMATRVSTGGERGVRPPGPC